MKKTRHNRRKRTMRRTRRVQKTRRYSIIHGGNPDEQTTPQQTTPQQINEIVKPRIMTTAEIMEPWKKTTAFQALTPPPIIPNREILINVKRPKTIRSNTHIGRQRSNEENN